MKLILLFQLFLYLSFDLVWADYRPQSSAEDAVYNQLTKAGSDPLDSLAYSILLRHMKRRPSGGETGSKPQISSYFVVDTSKKVRGGNFGVPSYDTAIDFPPLEYELPKDYSVSKEQIPIQTTTTTTTTTTQSSRVKSESFVNTVPKSAALPAPIELDSFVDIVPKSIPQPPRVELDTFASSSIRDSRPSQFQQPEFDTFANIIRKQRPQPSRAEINSFNNQFTMTVHENQFQNPQPHIQTQAFVNTFSSPSIDETKAQNVQIDAFEDNLSGIVGNQIRPSTKESADEYSTATVIDVPLTFASKPFRSRPQPALQKSEPQSVNLKITNEVRSSIPLPQQVGQKSQIGRVPLTQSQPTLAFSKTYEGYNDNFESPKQIHQIPPQSTPTYNKKETRINDKQVENAGRGSSNGFEKAIDLLTKFSNDFVSNDNNNGGDQRSNPQPTPTERSNIIKNSVDSNRGLHVVDAPFRLQPFNTQGNKMQFDSPSPQINFFNPPTKNNPRKQKFPSSHHFSSINSGPRTTHHFASYESKQNVRKDPYLVKLPVGYEIFKSIVREMR